MKPTLHVVGLPHTMTVSGSEVCAFTTKAVKFARMMRDQGYRVILYWGEENEADADEHVVCMKKTEQELFYGSFDPNILPTIEKFNANDPQWVLMNHRIIEEIQKRIEPRDIICLTMGQCHKSIADAFPNHRSVEHAVGYPGIFSPFVCFETYAWMHNVYGQCGINPGRFYDTVIPNFFFPEQFPIAEKPSDYLLFVGRLISQKGLREAYEVAKRSERKLLIAGPGMQEYEPGKRLVGVDVQLEGEGFEYIGILNPEERGKVMSEAHALLAPTTYIEPFGAVTVEANLSGTPAITTDWGAFTETVTEGLNGFRFRTLAEGARAVEDAASLNRESLRIFAQAQWSIDACGPRYDRWFTQLDGLWEEGWYN